MKKHKLLAVILIGTILLTGCKGNVDIIGTSGSNGNTSSPEDSESVSGEPIDVDFSSTDDDMFTDRDYEIGFENSNVILLKGDSITSESEEVVISGTTATITGSGTYVISGNLENGSIVVDAGDDDKPQIVLNGVSISSAESAAINIINADKVFITLAGDTENILESSFDAGIYSKADLTLNGSGKLEITSTVSHGITGKDDLVLTSGTYVIESASHGLDANDSIRIANANITVNSGKDGIHSENNDDVNLGFVYISSGNINIKAEGDGVSAVAYLQLEGGTIDITSGGGSVNGSSSSSGGYGGFMGGGRPGNSSSSSSSDSDSTSMKGIKSTGSMLISDGKITIDSADDSIHSNASIVINGGEFNLASGDDAIHGDEELSVTSGKITITKSYEGLEAQKIGISGGVISLVATDDGLNAAGGTDSSGTEGGRDGMFGPGGGSGGRPGGGFGGGFGGSSNGSIVISGGNIYINASGDGIDSNGTLEITGGYTVVCCPTRGDTATLDYDTTAVISGGSFIGTGAQGMAQTFSSSENQGVIAVAFNNMAAETEIKLTDSSGNIVISYAPELSYAVAILSSPDIKKGETYTLTVGSVSKDFQAG